MTIDTAAHRVFLYGEEVLLAQREFQLLMILIGTRCTIVTKAQLVRKVWSEEFDDETPIKSLQVHLSSLRKKLFQ